MRKLVRLQHRDAFEGSSSSGSSGSIESDRLNFVFIKISSTETLPQSLDPLARGRRRARLHQPRRNHSDSLARQKKFSDISFGMCLCLKREKEVS